MGRKDLTAERQALILDAMERCIIKYGLQGATLENLAHEAGINRGVIHHYIGNRDDVIKLMLDRLFEQYLISFEEYINTRPENNQAETIADYFFDAWFELAPEDDAIMLGLLAESKRDPHIRKVLLNSYDKFEKMIAGELTRLFPRVNAKDIHSTSYSLMALAIAHAALTWLGFKQAKQADVRLIAAQLVQNLK